ncbi:MAG: hypothetical protein RLZZ450_1571 [Pseudomonadota bacterium]
MIVVPYLASCSFTQQTKDSPIGRVEQHLEDDLAAHSPTSDVPAGNYQTASGLSTVESGVESPKGDARDVPVATQPKLPLSISPDIDEAVILAGQSLDTAEVDYEGKLMMLRRKAAENSALLRQRLPAVPQADFELRQRILSIVGELAATEEDASVLRDHALRRVAEDQPAAYDENDPRFVMDQGEDALAWVATFSLSRFALRNERAALAAIRAVLEGADRHIAFALAVELQEARIYRSDLGAILAARGISSKYSVPKEPERLQIENDQNVGQLAPPALEL